MTTSPTQPQFPQVQVSELLDALSPVIGRQIIDNITKDLEIQGLKNYAFGLLNPPQAPPEVANG